MRAFSLESARVIFHEPSLPEVAIADYYKGNLSFEVPSNSSQIHGLNCPHLAAVDKM